MKGHGASEQYTVHGTQSSIKWICQMYTEAKVDVTQEIEQRAQCSAPAWVACSISCVISTLASVYGV